MNWCKQLKVNQCTCAERELRGDKFLARLHREGDPRTPINVDPFAKLDEHPIACIDEAMNASK